MQKRLWPFTMFLRNALYHRAEKGGTDDVSALHPRGQQMNSWMPKRTNGSALTRGRNNHRPTLITPMTNRNTAKLSQASLHRSPDYGPRLTSFWICPGSTRPKWAHTKPPAVPTFKCYYPGNCPAGRVCVFLLLLRKKITNCLTSANRPARMRAQGA